MLLRSFASPPAFGEEVFLVGCPVSHRNRIGCQEGVTVNEVKHYQVIDAGPEWLRVLERLGPCLSVNACSDLDARGCNTLLHKRLEAKSVTL